MHQIVYVSDAKPDLTAVDLFRIIEQSARNNPNAEITGFLIYRGGRFLQLIEGPLMALESLLAKLKHDPRHGSLEVLSRVPIPARSFPRWRMKRVGEDGDAAAELDAALRAEGGGAVLPSPVLDFIQRPLAA